VLGLSVKSIDRAIKNGDLKALQVGARIFVPLSELEPGVVNKLHYLRGPGERYTDIILKLAGQSAD
jgi:hypothetical protein